MRCESCHPERTLEPKAIEEVEESRGKIRHPGGPKASWSVAIGSSAFVILAKAGVE